jgi:hypothetical protein
LLIGAGIGERSPALRSLLDLDLDEQYVEAHVLEFLAVRDGVAESLRPFTTGLLIRRLMDGDVAPLMRCGECLVVPNRAGICRCLVR